MNRFMQESWEWVAALHGMRAGILDSLSDAELGFNPGGENVSFGRLFVGMGEVEHSYIASLETFEQDWSYRNTDAGLAASASGLKPWFQALDGRLEATVSALSDEDLAKPVARPGGNAMPVELQLQVYMQAVFIFLGKAVVYLRAMNKPRPPYVDEFIG
ncbi:MAG: DinB family protein [Actinomycetota bacterium]|nr:DinB family protein [Actinomycetota bacterium]